MKSFLLVGLGGCIGAMLRFGISGWIDRSSGLAFPLGTLTVNVLGCFLIGLLASHEALVSLIGEQGRLLLAVGLLGGFTTYSSFALDAFQQASVGEMGKALLYVGLHMVVGLAAVWLGFRLGGGP